MANGLQLKAYRESLKAGSNNKTSINFLNQTLKGNIALVRLWKVLWSCRVVIAFVCFLRWWDLDFLKKDLTGYDKCTGVQWPSSLLMALNSKAFPIWNVRLGRADPTLATEDVAYMECVPENINGKKKKVRDICQKQCHYTSPVTEGAWKHHHLG